MARVLARDVVITTLLLGLFAAVGAGLVASVQSVTEARIAENEAALTRARVTEVLKSLDYDNDPVADQAVTGHPWLGGSELPVWFARRGDEVVGVALSVIAPSGYSGSIHMLVGIDREGTVLGVRVTRHKETPGLGDDIEADRSDWIRGFTGRSLADPPPELWRVRRDGGIFDQFTGATVTPRAVVQAVRSALVYFRDHGEALMALAAPLVEPERPEAPQPPPAPEPEPSAEEPGPAPGPEADAAETGEAKDEPGAVVPEAEEEES